MPNNSGTVSSSEESKRAQQDQVRLDEEEENLAEFLILFDPNASGLVSSSTFGAASASQLQVNDMSLQTLRRKRELSESSPTHLPNGHPSSSSSASLSSPDKRARYSRDSLVSMSSGQPAGEASAASPSPALSCSPPLLITGDALSSARLAAASPVLSGGGGGKKWTEMAVGEVSATAPRLSCLSCVIVIHQLPCRPI